MTRQQISERLEEIDKEKEKLKHWREGFQEHISYIDFELEDLQQERHYLIEEFLSKPIFSH